jgi:hypothetical protein
MVFDSNINGLTVTNIQILAHPHPDARTREPNGPIE